jgi:hypothetical protein
MIFLRLILSNRTQATEMHAHASLSFILSTVFNDRSRLPCKRPFFASVITSRLFFSTSYLYPVSSSSDDGPVILPPPAARAPVPAQTHARSLPLAPSRAFEIFQAES